MSKSSNNKRKSGAYQPRKPLEGNRIRVRSRRLDQIDEDKLSLAFWLLAKQLVEDQTDTDAATGTDDTPDDDSEPDEVAA